MIASADAGSSDTDALESALDVLRDECSVEVQHTRDPSELDSVLHRAGSRRIIVAGGDGSIHAVVAALHRRNELKSAVLGLIPLGTGNDFARTLGIPLDPVEAAKVLVTGEVRPLDLLLDEVGGIVVNHVHLGVGAEASRYGDAWKERVGRIGVGRLRLSKLGLRRLGYPMGAARTAVEPQHGLRLRVEVDGEVVADCDRPVLMVAIGNGAHVGGGTELTPDADPTDGVCDVMVSRAVGPLARMGYVVGLLTRRHPERDDVTVRRGTRVSVAGESFWCSADGEIYGPERHRTWRVEPAAYSMVLPPGGRPVD